MLLILTPLSHSKAIKIILQKGDITWEDVAPQGEDIAETLDKLFEIAKINKVCSSSACGGCPIDLRSVKSMCVMAEEHSSLLSVYLAHTTKQALRIAKEFQNLRR